ncbi:MAG: amidohydrolase family protein [Gemmatimonadales bacterium]
MVTDVSAFVGGYPYRHVEPADPDSLLRHMERMGIERAWVGYLPAFLYRDPRAGNRSLARVLSPHADRLAPIPTLNPGLPGWQQDLNEALAHGAPAVRLYPQHQGLDPVGDQVRVASVAAAAGGLSVVLTVKFEDRRQRHPLDTAPDLPPSAVRALARSDPDLRLIVTGAERDFVEEVHFGLTPDEAARILWDFAWVWGPPEDHLAHLLDVVGVERFTLGTWMPLRIPDAVFAKLDLLDLNAADRKALLGGNLERWLSAQKG